jgi:hypothetical protein
MEDIQQTLQSWQMFYATVATASATLSGLLFVSLSLHRDHLKGTRGQAILATARRTFSNFLYVLMIALVFLVPHQAPYSLTTALLVLGLSRTFGLVRDARLYLKPQPGRVGVYAILREVALPSLAAIGLIAVGIDVALGSTEVIFVLVGVIAALLIIACWNAWLLLIET